MTTEFSAGHEFTFGYNLGGALTSINYPDDAYVVYGVNVAGETTSVSEGGVVLASYAYDALGRRQSIVRGNGVVTNYGWDAVSRLTTLGFDIPGGTAQDGGSSFTYTSAGQIRTRATSNPNLWAWRGEAPVTTGYTANGLDQYVAIGSTGAPVHDANGNLVRGEGHGFGFAYDAENQLRIADDLVTFRDLSYDPLGRVRRVGAGGVELVHAGAQLMIEYSASGSVMRRHVFGPGLDAPLVTVTGGARAWWVADERGSVVASTDAAGAVTATFGYGPSGEPDARGMASRFGFTGAVALPELGLTQMRART